MLSVHDSLTCEENAVGPMSGGIPVTATCRTEDNGGTLGPRHLDVNAFSGLSTEELPTTGQTAFATARLINEIEIPAAPATGGVEVLPVQVATEVSWSGVLLAAGLNSTFAQGLRPYRFGIRRREKWWRATPFCSNALTQTSPSM